MLAILQFDAASAAVLQRLLDDGRLPTLAGLHDRGIYHDLDAPATQFAAGAQHTLYSGVELGEHGLFYPFQWSAEDQRARYMHDFYGPPPIWERLGREAGTRTLAVDPYESREAVNPPPGSLVCGWQLHDRVVLRQWSHPHGTHRKLERLFGKPQPVDEVFGLHTAREMLALRRRLLGAPGRVADAATLFLQEEPFDLAWLTFCAAHIAGHQFWDLSQVEPAGLDASSERVLAGALDEVYEAVDAAIARVLAALPPDADLIVLSPVGMDVNTSRADMLPEMLRRILDDPIPEPAPANAAHPQTDSGRRSRASDAPFDYQNDGGSTGSGSIWMLRATVPPGLRATVARALPEKVALDLTAWLELRGHDWSTTKAFAHPAENQGYIRLNLRGRERDGIVDPSEADELMDQITDGIRTFTHFDGSPAVASVERVDGIFGTGERAHQLPDLIVRWVNTPATKLEGLRSQRFGTVYRHGVGSGRSGNHTEGDAWALLVPGTAEPVTLSRRPRLEDIAATAAALSGADTGDMAGVPLLVTKNDCA